MVKLDSDKFIKHISEKWKNNICPMCKGNNWNYDDILITPVGVSENKELNLGGKIFPLVAVTCLDCGNTIFVNALVASCIIDSPDEKKEG